MISTRFINNLANEIRNLGECGQNGLEEAVEKYLDDSLREITFKERLPIIEKVAEKFEETGHKTRRSPDFSSKETERLLSLLLGTEISFSGNSPPDAPEKLAELLNTIFDTLNRLVAVIHTTLLGRSSELETIRHVIGSQIVGGVGEAPLKTYLDQIQKAFLIAHEAFQEASKSIVKEMLSNLDPDLIAGSTKNGLKFGLLRKVEQFEACRARYRECKSWVDAGHFSEKLLREFEKTCQRTFKAE